MGSSTVTLPNAEGPVTITLFKSKQLMNVSGPSIVTAYRSSRNASGGAGGRAPGKDLVVLGDSISHAPMKLSARFGGSAQGHNGLKSISAALRSDKGFWQFRVGVGRGRSEDGRRSFSIYRRRCGIDNHDQALYSTSRSTQYSGCWPG